MDDYEEIELLGDEFHHALLGAVYEQDGTPVPCYSSGVIVESLMSEGYSEEAAVDYINEVTDGAKILDTPTGARAGVHAGQQAAPAPSPPDGLRRKDQRNIADKHLSDCVRKSAQWKCQRCEKDYTDKPQGLQQSLH